MISKPHAYLLLGLAAIGLALPGCGAGSLGDAVEIKIVATGNVNGEIEPCG